MTPAAVLAISAALWAGAAPCARAATTAPATLAVTGAWSRPAAAGTNGVGYFTVINRGAKADAIVAIETPLATRGDMHAMTMAGGVMSMQKVTSIPVPAGGKAEFGPGGHHVMLVGLKRALKPGDKVPATLTFASGAHAAFAFTVALTSPPAS